MTKYAARRGAAILTAVTLVAPATNAGAQRASRGFEAPARMLWAWERPEDLRFLASEPAASRPGVAFLAHTVYLRGAAVIDAPRRQPLRVPDATYLVAVVRVEGARRSPAATHSEAQLAHVVDVLRQVAALPAVRAVQLDYDALASERGFYRALLARARAVLAPSVALTMTALASWCLGDRWLDEPPMPVDAVVPMLFTMGARATADVRERLARTGDFASPRCATDVGYALHEPALSLRGSRRVWLFDRAPWTEAQWLVARARWGRSSTRP